MKLKELGENIFFVVCVIPLGVFLVIGTTVITVVVYGSLYVWNLFSKKK